MPRKIKEQDLVYRTVPQLRGVRSQLVAAINSCTNGAQIELDIRSARNLVEVCDVAIDELENPDSNLYA